MNATRAVALDEVGTLLTAGRREPAGSLRIATPALLGRIVIAPLLPCLLARDAAVSVELLLIDHAVNLVEDDIHLAIRVGRLPDSAFVARKLGDVRMIVCAAPSYFERRGAPCSPDELHRHDCLVFSDGLGPSIVADTRLLVASPDLPMPPAPGSEAQEQEVPAVVLSTARPAASWQLATSPGNVCAFIPVPVLRLSSLLMVHEAVLEGASAALLPGLLVARDVAAGRLACWGKDAGPPVEVWALYSSRRLLSAKVRAFLDMLRELDEADRAPPVD
ncbi:MULTISPECIES: substrate binding domain-containing protein [unclassified Caballeronia]|uniref:substrate binding domain-containing protein n=1 Tax=unclassified Caballeronia TaxID=2646786 RepID=UPI00285EBA07|nr:MULTISPECIES: substrate binding domain-containing protein [unclassified Caballeronia]MDR5752464.1 substrate binding domain-containing protein [Caballeronia sp. LZ024]MDR5845270.1 substrate binding domain-containing protein [Caballeronia sp. LZ031]